MKTESAKYGAVVVTFLVVGIFGGVFGLVACDLLPCLWPDQPCGGAGCPSWVGLAAGVFCGVGAVLFSWDLYERD